MPIFQCQLAMILVSLASVVRPKARLKARSPANFLLLSLRLTWECGRSPFVASTVQPWKTLGCGCGSPAWYNGAQWYPGTIAVFNRPKKKARASGKRLHSYGQLPFLLGKPTINVPFSMTHPRIKLPRQDAWQQLPTANWAGPGGKRGNSPTKVGMC